MRIFLTALIFLISSNIFATSTGKLFLKTLENTERRAFDKFDTVKVSLIDSDLNLDSASVQSVNINVSSSVTETTPIILTLTETSENTSIFEGYFYLDSSSTFTSGDDILQVTALEEIIVSYNDSLDSLGGLAVIEQKAVFAGMVVEGLIPNMSVWTIMQSPIVANSTFWVGGSDTLNIQPGVEILMLPDTGYYGRDSIKVTGRIQAIGGVSDSIIFKSYSASPKQDDWFGFFVSSGGSVDLQYCSIANAYNACYFYYYNSGMFVNNLIRHSNFSNNYYRGIYQYIYNSAYITTVIDSNTFNHEVIHQDSNYYSYYAIYASYDSYDGSKGDSLLISNNQINITNANNDGSRSVYGIYLNYRVKKPGFKPARILRNTIVSDTLINNSDSLNTKFCGIYNNASSYLIIDSNTVSKFAYGLFSTGDYNYKDTNLSVIANTFSDCKIGVSTYQYTQNLIFNYNNFVNIDSFAFTHYGNLNGINANYNYWGVSGTAEMSSGGNPKNISVINDFYDDSYNGVINYAGWLAAENGVAHGIGKDGKVFLQNSSMMAVDAYSSNDTIWVVVEDGDLNITSGTAETVNVLIKSSTETTGESIILTEVTPDDSVFTGYIVVKDNGDPQPNGELDAINGDEIIVVYTDVINNYSELVLIEDTVIFLTNIIPDNIETNTTWLKINSPYILTSSVTVNSTCTLTIEPGVEVRFKDPGNSNLDSLKINGTLIANGTLSDSIIFRSTKAVSDTLDWYGIYLNQANAEFDYCTFRNSNTGIYASWSSSVNKNLSVSRSTFINNKKAVHIYANNADSFVVSIDSNLIDVVAVDTMYATAFYISSNSSSNAYDSFYIADNNIRFHNNGRLSGKGIEISQRGGLVRKSNILRNIIIADSISTDNSWYNEGIKLYSAKNVNVEYNIVEGFVDGIRTSSDSLSQFLYNKLSNNRNNFYLEYGVTSVINFNSFTDPLDYSMKTESYDNSEINARFNYWGESARTEMDAGNNPKNIIDIFDNWDNNEYSKINYSGWLNDTNGTKASTGNSAIVWLTDSMGLIPSLYQGNDTVWIYVRDKDLNTNITIAQTVTVDLSSATESSPEFVQLTEIDVDTSVFKGFIVLENNASAIAANAKLQILTGEFVKLTYNDVANDYGENPTLIFEVGYAANVVSGIIAANTTWTKAASPHIINGTVIVEVGVTLTIEAGAEVRFVATEPPDEWSIIVDTLHIKGTLNAIGTESDSIIFTTNSPIPGLRNWFGILVDTAMANIEYCAISNAVYGVYINNYNNNGSGKSISTIVRNCNFRDNVKQVYSNTYNYPQSIIIVDSSDFEVNVFKNDSLGFDGLYFEFEGSNGDSLRITDNNINMNNTGLVAGNHWYEFSGIKIYNRNSNTLYKSLDMLRNSIVFSEAEPADNHTYYGLNVEYLDASNVSYNILINCGKAIHIGGDSGSVYNYNTITGGKIGISISYNGSYSSAFNFNNFDNIDSLTFLNEGSDTINATQNFWGNASVELDSGTHPRNVSFIYDNYDYGSAGLVDYSNWLGGSSVNEIPVVSSSPIDSIKFGYNYKYQILATDADSDSMGYFIQTAPSGFSVNDTGLVEWLADTAGSLWVSIAVTDTMDTVFHEFTLWSIMDSAPPINEYTVSASVIDDTSLTLSWTLDSSLVAEVDSIGIWLKVGSIPTSSTDTVASLIMIIEPNDSSIVIGGLTEKTNYYFALMLRDSSSNWSLPEEPAIDSAITADSTAPINNLVLNSNILSETSVELSWNASSLIGSDAQTVMILYNDSIAPSGILDTLNSEFHVLTASDSLDVITGLNSKTQYFFSIIISDTVGNWSDTSFSSSISLITPDSTAPVNDLVLSSVPTDSGIWFNWNESLISDTDVEFIRLIVREGTAPENAVGDSVNEVLFNLPLGDSTKFISSVMFTPDTLLILGLVLIDSIGNTSLFAFDSTMYTPPLLPLNVAGLVAVENDFTSINVSWNVSDTLIDSVLVRVDTATYVIDTNVSSAYAWVMVTKPDTSVVISGLKDGRTYYINTFTFGGIYMNDTSSISQTSVSIALDTALPIIYSVDFPEAVEYGKPIVHSIQTIKAVFSIDSLHTDSLAYAINGGAFGSFIPYISGDSLSLDLGAIQELKELKVTAKNKLGLISSDTLVFSLLYQISASVFNDSISYYSINSAIENANSGDTLEIFLGKVIDYPINIFNKTNLTIMPVMGRNYLSVDSERVVIDVANKFEAPLVIDSSSLINITGLVLKGGTKAGILISASDSIHIEKNLITGNVGSAILKEVSDNMYMVGSKIYSNIIETHSLSEISLLDVQFVEIEFNTIIGAGAISAIDLSSANSEDNLIMNNIIAGNASVLVDSNSVVDNNLFEIGPGIGSKDVIGDPLFVNSSIGDYSIMPGSPAIGMSNFNLMSTDINGDLRPMPAGRAWDVGAIEEQTDIGNTAPVFVGIDTIDIFEDSLFTYSISMNDAEGDSLSFSSLNLPSWLTLSDSNLSGLATQSDIGRDTILISVSDKDTVIDVKLFLNVLNVNDAPLFVTKSISDSVILENRLFVLPLFATDLDLNDSLIFKLAANTTMARIDSLNRFVWKPKNADVGSFNFTVFVMDIAGAKDSIALNLTVENVNESPIFVSLGILDSTILEDNNFVWHLSATDADFGDSLSYNILGGSSLAFIDSNNSFVWNPSNLEVGLDTFLIVASDREMLSDSIRLILNVKNVNDSPTIVISSKMDSSFAAIRFYYQVKDVDRIHSLDSFLNVEIILWDILGNSDTLKKSNIVSSLDNTVEFFPVYAGSYNLVINVVDENSAIGTDTLYFDRSTLNSKIISSNSWTMFSLPSYSSSINNYVDVLDTLQNVFTWDSELEKYSSKIELDSIKRAHGYWGYFDGLQCSLYIANQNKIETLDTFNLDLKQGWNMISSPYPFAIQWTTIVGDTQEVLHFYNPITQVYDTSYVMEPWKSYFYMSDTAKTITLLPIAYNPDIIEKQNVTARLGKSLFASDDEWRLKLSLIGTATKDPYNYIGLSNFALLGKDKNDRMEPPISPNAGASLAFENSGRRLCSDIRNAGKGTYEFILEVASGIDRPSMEIDFLELESVCENRWIYFANENEYVEVNMQNSKVSVNATDKTFYRVYVTDDANFLDRVVKGFKLSQNYPNPFNPSTTIKYSIPVLFTSDGKALTAKQTVNISIYDVRGRLVMSHKSLAKTGKRYSLKWNANNNIASGVYFYRLTVGNTSKVVFSQTKKMLLLK